MFGGMGAGTLPRAMYASFNMMMGSFDAEILDDSYAPTIAYLVYFEYILLVNIVMLNLLIALMGGSYEKVAEKAERETLKQRAELIVTYEQKMTKAQLANKQWHPTYVHALVPTDDDEGSQNEEAGVVNGVKRLFAAQHKDFQRLEDIMTKERTSRIALEKLISDNTTEIEKVISAKHAEAAATAMAEKVATSVGIRWKSATGVGKAEAAGGDSGGEITELKAKVATLEAKMDEVSDTTKAMLAILQQQQGGK